MKNGRTNEAGKSFEIDEINQHLFEIEPSHPTSRETVYDVTVVSDFRRNDVGCGLRTVSEPFPKRNRPTVEERERAGRRECHTTAPAKTVVRFSSCTRRVARPSHPTLSCLLLTICHFDFVCPSLLNPHTVSQLVVQLGSAPAPTHTSNKVMNSNLTKQYLELF